MDISEWLIIIDRNSDINNFSGPVKRALAAILPWLESGHPAIIRGPEGCGKSSVISAALASRKDEIGESSSVVRGSSLYGPQDLLTRLKRSCVRVESSINGRNYRPRNGSRLVLILEDVHLASKELQVTDKLSSYYLKWNIAVDIQYTELSFDSWGRQPDVQLMNNYILVWHIRIYQFLLLQELIRELLQEGGFHEDDLEFASLPIMVLCTGDENTRLHPRLEALLATHYLP